MTDELKTDNGIEDVDKLYDDAMASESSNIPMESDKVEPVVEKFKFTANGKEIEASRDEVLKWASQGHDYSQKMQALKSDRSTLDNELSYYKQVDEWAKANPEQWEYIKNAYDNKEAPTQDAYTEDEYTDPVVAELQNQIKELSEFKNSFETKQRLLAQQEEDQLLTSEIKSIREKYSNLDWSKQDEAGNDLERRILGHAQKNGIQSFQAAFRDFMHEDLIKQATEAGKELVSKDLAAKTKLGLLGTTKTPTKGQTKAVNLRSKTYDDLMNEAIEEMGGL